MKISSIDFIPVSIAYTHRESSAQVDRDGVTDVLVKATTDNGLVGWGESCSGANVESVVETLKAMRPFVLGRSPVQPLYNLLGGKVRDTANYFYYLKRGSSAELAEQCQQGRALGFHVFY